MIRIYRYGRYINEVSGDRALRGWLSDNLILEPGVGASQGTELAALLLQAGNRGYTFESDRKARKKK